MVDASELWTCPSCGKRFVTTNIFHSGGRHTIEDFLAGKSDTAIAM